MYLILAFSSLFTKVEVQISFFRKQNDVDNAFANLMPFFSISAIEIAKTKPRKILSRQDRKIKYARN